MLIGRIHQLNVSDGGVPKTPVDQAVVDARGLVDDRQADRRHHGRDWQALCLWSLEVIERMAAEGHPIGPGLAGENVTVAGLDWWKVVPGACLRLGPDVLAETTHYAIPCYKNAGWFLDRDFGRMAEDAHPGESRIYARVLQGGTLRPGDPVEVDLAEAPAEHRCRCNGTGPPG